MVFIYVTWVEKWRYLQVLRWAWLVNGVAALPFLCSLCLCQAWAQWTESHGHSCASDQLSGLWAPFLLQRCSFKGSHQHTAGWRQLRDSLCSQQSLSGIPAWLLQQLESWLCFFFCLLFLFLPPPPLTPDRGSCGSYDPLGCFAKLTSRRFYKICKEGYHFFFFLEKM